MQSNRVRILYVNRQDVVELLAVGGDWPEWIAVKKLGVPKGAEVLEVRYNMVNRQFEFVLAHESFDEVRPGAYIPPFHTQYAPGTETRVYRRADAAPAETANAAAIRYAEVLSGLGYLTTRMDLPDGSAVVKYGLSTPDCKFPSEAYFMTDGSMLRPDPITGLMRGGRWKK